MTSFKSLLFPLSLVALSLMADVEAATSVKVAVSFPANSAGSKIAKTLPTTTKISPCNDTLKLDALTFTATYDAADPASTTAVPLPLLDLYLFFYNPDGVTGANKFYSVSKGLLGAGVAVTAYADAAAIQVAQAAGTLIPYLAGTNNFNTASFTDTLFGSSIRFDAAPSGVGTGLNTGTWELIGILADSTVDFTDPATWKAWDVAVVMAGMPWKGTAATVLATCQ